MKERMRRLAVLFLTGTVVITSTPTFSVAASAQNDNVAGIEANVPDTDNVTEPEEETDSGEETQAPETENEVSLFSGDTKAAEEPAEVVHYAMEPQDGVLKNQAQEGMDGTLNNIAEKNFHTYNGTSTLTMDGKGSIQLPAGIVTDNTMTVTITAASTLSNTQWLWAFGKDSWDYTFLTPANASKKTKFSVAHQAPYNSTGAWAAEKNIEIGARALDGSYQTYTVVYNGDKTTLYLNGEKVGEGSNPYNLAEMVPASGISGYIGKSFYSGDPLFKGQVADFSVANYAMTDEEVVAAAQTEFAGYVKADIYAAMLKDNTDGSQVDSNLSFPASVDGIALTWGEPSDTVLVGTDGTVTLPLEEDTTVNIPVTFQCDGQEQQETFSITVKAVPASDRVKEAAEALKLPYTEVYGNITLPDSSINNTTVKWETDHPKIVDLETHENEGYDATPAGTVTRPDKDTKVTMKATISLGEEKTTKNFEFTVKAKPEEIKESDYTDYFFTYFAGEKYSDGEQIYFASSEDGLNWMDLNENKPVLTSSLGEQGVRDPHILRSPEGDKFYMIATDLKIHGNNDWGAAQRSGSQSLMVWESTDLVNWSEQRMVKVARDDAGCTWAPETTYDEKTGEYIVYWASRVAEDGFAKQRVYYAKTRDFYTFTEPEVMIEKSNDVIDTTILKENGAYYRYSKDESHKCIMSDKVETLLHADPTDIETSTLQSQGGVEGPTIFKLNDDDNKDWKYCLLVDNYGGIGYYPLVSNDLDGDFTKLNSGFQMPSKARHGTPIRITAEEYKNVVDAYGNLGVNDEKESKEAVLEYNFETDEGTTIKDTATGNETADNGTLYGNAKIAEDSQKNSKVLTLDGSKNTYGAFPEGFFDGRDKVTISMDVKSEKDSGNFFTFAFGKDSTKYDYMRVRGTNVYNGLTTGSYQKEHGVSGTGVEKGKWQNVTIVIDEKKMELYLDGRLVSTNDNTVYTPSQMGKNLLAYLGKSFYGNDEYFKGSFDNIKVFNRALTWGEILDTTGIVLPGIVGVNAEGYTFINTKIDEDKKTVHIDVSRNNSENYDLANVPLHFEIPGNAEIVGENDKSLDLTKPVKVKVKNNGAEETWTIDATLCNNAVLPGQYADPDIDVLDGKFYIYPTTDGFEGWSGTQFHAFSSEDMINWTDEGVIVDVKSNDEVAGTNENGVAIAGVPWAVGSAWAPTIEEKNGKYYFYFCAKESNGKSAIGVAVSDSPKGPFVAQDTPLVSMDTCSANGINMGQAIDPSIYTEAETGKSYMLFGNGNAAIVELGDDMMSLVPGTMKNMSGAKDFREAITVTKRGGLYHFTWSCDDTGSENYHINYGTSDSLYGPITFQSTILSKDASQSILGTGHHSIVQIPEKDEYYIAYHRFVTPLGQYTSGFGYHRETCIDKLEFDKETGLMKQVTPTLTGITEPVNAVDSYTVTFVDKDGKVIDTQKVKKGDAATAPTAPKVEGYEFTGWDKDFSKVTGELTVKALYKKVQTAKWVQQGNRWWYDNGDGTWPENTWKLIDGKWYHFDKEGYMQTGWLKLGNKWYYLTNSGAMATGWVQLGRTWYYLAGDGSMATGWLKLGNTWYYLNSSGAMAADWVKVGNTWYYCNASGAMVTGWAKVWGKWYYLNGNGAMATGWKLLGNTWYYLKDNGAMVTGWVKVGSKWYYCNGSGAMQTGWVKVGGKWYYLYSNGAMASKTWVGKYYVNASGVWTKTR